MGRFLVVFFVSILACGIFMTALLYPDDRFVGSILLHLLLRPSLMLVGESGVEHFDCKRFNEIIDILP